MGPFHSLSADLKGKKEKNSDHGIHLLHCTRYCARKPTIHSA